MPSCTLLSSNPSHASDSCCRRALELLANYWPASLRRHDLKTRRLAGYQLLRADILSRIASLSAFCTFLSASRFVGRGPASGPWAGQALIHIPEETVASPAREPSRELSHSPVRQAETSPVRFALGAGLGRQREI